MRFIKSIICILALSFLAVTAFSQDPLDDPKEDAAARSEIRDTMGSDIFTTSPSGTSATGPAAARASYNAAGGVTGNLAGAWHLDLMDSTIRSLDVSMVQVEDALFGRGSMALGNGTEEVYVSGEVTSSGVSLDIIPVGEVALYRADLRLNGRALSGSFKAFSPYTKPWTGIATGSIAA